MIEEQFSEMVFLNKSKVSQAHCTIFYRSFYLWSGSIVIFGIRENILGLPELDAKSRKFCGVKSVLN